jgi:glucosamine-6-phosphate deaminase
MKIIKAKDYADMSRKAADLIAAQILIKPDCVLGLATGSTPIGAYEELVRRNAAGELDFSQVTSINLDEYRGLSPENDQSYRYFMNDHLFNHVNIDKKNTFVPNGLEPDAQKACSDYDEIIRTRGPIDLQLLGLGHNGHIGFNEPADCFSKGTNCVNLTHSTIDANKRFFASEAEVPTQAYTMGCAGIMSARKILLIVSGLSKAEIVREVICGPVTPAVPASLLQLHPDVTLIADAEALSVFEA